MKNILILILFTYPLFSFSQKNKSTFTGGISLGFNACQVDGDNRAGYRKIGLNAGPWVNFKLYKNFKFNLELLFSQKGARWAPDQSLYPNRNYKINLNYADVPLYISYTDKEKYAFGLGLSYGQLVKASEYIDFIENISAQNSFSKKDLTWLADFKVNLTEHFGANIRFNYSLVPIRSTSEAHLANSNVIVTNAYYRNAQYNHYISCRLFYQF